MNDPTRSLNRRSFLSHTVRGAGGAALTGLAGTCVHRARADASKGKRKALFATTDYFDNVLINDRFFDRDQLNQLNARLASLGVTRHQWIFDPMWTFYEDYPLGFDLFAEAAAAAHAHGLEFYALIKPFEGGGFGTPLPITMPFPDGAVAFKDLRGIFPGARRFSAAHPEMCLKCRPAADDFSGPIATIRLVKGHDGPTRVKKEHLSVWTSATNNRFVRYEGPITFRETVEWRKRFPKWRPCRILHLEGLEIPQDHAYVLVRCSLADQKGDFANENGNLLELAGPNGEPIPHTLSSGRGSLDKHQRGVFGSKVMRRSIRYLRMPEVEKELSDPERMRRHFQDFYEFDDYKVTDWIFLDKVGFVAAVRGKPEHMLGNLHPIYPEVRRHWLDLARYCLDRGADGINFRVANHVRPPEPWEYGFNEPVLEAAGGKTDYPTISRINGDAYTQFLREARELLTSRGKRMTVHLHSGMLAPDDRGRIPPLPPNFEWQWETWVKEIADELEFRGCWTLRPWNLRKVLDTYIAAVAAAGKPLHFQSDFHTMTNFEGRRQCKREEIDFVKNHPGLDGFVLYETANYTTIGEDGRVELRPHVEELIRERW